MIRLSSFALALPLVLGVFVPIQFVRAQNTSDGYASLKNRPLPRNAAQRDSECAWIRSEEARIRSQAQSGAATAAQFNSPALAQSIEAAANRDLPLLDNRYAAIQCERTPAASPQPVVMRSQAVSQPPPPPPPAATAPSSAAVAPPPAPIAPLPATATAAPAVAAASQSCSELTFDRCFAKCRELTDRSKAQCFDACRH